MMNNIYNACRPFGFLKSERSLLLLPLLFFYGFAFAAPTTPTRDFINNKDGTVTHKATGLTWMRCAMGQTWTGSRCTGTPDTYTYDQAVALTNNFAGHSDWRLPNIAELQTIVERDNIYPALNTEMFPSASYDMFWSSSPVAGNTNYAWSVYFDFGRVENYYDRNHSFAVRLVRASQSLGISSSTPNSDFTDNHDGTVTHKRTGLVWQRCAVGQTWTGSSCSGSAGYYSYDQALALSSNFAGHSDWRVPNANDLVSILNYDALYPLINQDQFPNVDGNKFWSSSSLGIREAWSVFFSYGYVDYDLRDASFAVRLVRASRSINYWPLTISKKGSGIGTVSSNPAGINCGKRCSKIFPFGKKVTLSAMPNADSVFVRWEGDCTGRKNHCTVTANKNRSVAAVFGSTLPIVP